MSADVVVYDEPDSLPALRERVAAAKDSVPTGLTIGSEEEAANASDLLSGLADVRRDAEAERKGAKSYYLEGGRHVDRLFNEVLGPVAKAEKVVKDGLLGWRKEVQRRIAEQAAKALEAQKEADAAAELAAMGAIDEVAPDELPAPPPPPSASPGFVQTGRSRTQFAQTWKCEVPSDEAIRELCAAVASGRVPPQAVKPDLVFLRQMLMAMPVEQREAYAVPGVRYFQVDSVASR